MRVIGAVLAGGRARRFGSDKALATLDGVTLIDRVTRALAARAAAVIVVGREPGIADRYPGIGPLGGLAAALHVGADRGYDAVLSAPCDTPVLPQRLFDELFAAGAPSCQAGSPVIGLWPCRLAALLDHHVRTSADRSMRAWAGRCGAAIVASDAAIANINTPADLAALTAADPSSR